MWLVLFQSGLFAPLLYKLPVPGKDGGAARQLKAGWDANVEDYHHYSVIPHEMARSLQSMAGSLLSMSFMRFWGMAEKSDYMGK